MNERSFVLNFRNKSSVGEGYSGWMTPKKRSQSSQLKGTLHDLAIIDAVFPFPYYSNSSRYVIYVRYIISIVEICWHQSPLTNHWFELPRRRKSCCPRVSKDFLRSSTHSNQKRARTAPVLRKPPTRVRPNQNFSSTCRCTTGKPRIDPANLDTNLGNGSKNVQKSNQNNSNHGTIWTMIVI